MIIRQEQDRLFSDNRQLIWIPEVQERPGDRQRKAETDQSGQTRGITREIGNMANGKVRKGLFGLFGKKKEEPEKNVSEGGDEVPGWDAIEAEFLRIYPGQTSPKHYAAILPWMLGGKDPLDGISIYDGGDYWHFVSFGQTELYRKESEDPQISGYGYELTFKLRKQDPETDEPEIRNVCGILQSIARLTFTKGEIFRPFEFIHTGQTTGIDAFQKSALTGFITVPDPLLRTIRTPYGEVSFLELIGMTDAELRSLSDHASVEAIYGRLGSDVTDYVRASLI